MALAIEQLEETGKDMSTWDLPESLPENTSVSLRVLGDFSDLTPGELTRVNFGVTEAARAIVGGGDARLGFGYTLEPRTRNVYSVTHQGVGEQSPVEGMIIRRGPMAASEFVLFQARRV